MKERITLLGSGWLGLELAKKLLAQNKEVFVTTRNEIKFNALEKEGLVPIVYSEQHNYLPEKVVKSDFVIINFPPSKSIDYPGQIAKLVSLVDPNSIIIFTSSTRVYPQESGVISEESYTDSNHVVALAENVIQQSKHKWIILRLAGLVDSDRNPVRFLTGREIINGQHPINLVHRQDCIQAILELVKRKLTNQIFNLVYPNHPSKEEYYTAKATQLGLVPPVFKQGESSGKIVDGSKIERLTSFNYSHKP